MPDPIADLALLSAAIRLSGLSARQFAVRVLIRDERTLRRWIAGKSPIPKAVRLKCESLISSAPVEVQ